MVAKEKVKDEFTPNTLNASQGSKWNEIDFDPLVEFKFMGVEKIRLSQPPNLLWQT
jgi:hypothetical protein